MKIGVCIGTYAAVPYLNLSLEALRRNEPGVDVLVHDDSSGYQDALKILCEEYGATFASTPYRMAPVVGDISAFVAALEWGRDSGLDVVCKWSRRWIVHRPWADGLTQLVENYGYSTYSEADAHFGFGFRSECVAMVVKDWLPRLPELTPYIVNNSTPGLAEGMYHDIARRIHMTNLRTQRYEQMYPPCHLSNAFGKWPLMGMARTQKVRGVLWHDSHTAADYAALAAEYGLPYPPAAFSDPNMGERDRPR